MQTFTCAIISLKKNHYILIHISLTFVSKGTIDNDSELLQIMAWCRTSDKLSTETMLCPFTDSYIDGLVQDCTDSIANAMELLQSCGKPSIWAFFRMVTQNVLCYSYRTKLLRKTSSDLKQTRPKTFYQNIIANFAFGISPIDGLASFIVSSWDTDSLLCVPHIRVMSYEHHGLLNHRQLNRLFNSLFRQPPRRPSKVHVTVSSWPDGSHRRIIKRSQDRYLDV